jgi:hypothetical protein
VILRPPHRKRNQCVMNDQQSTSIPGKHHPENHKGEGNRSVVWPRLCFNMTGTRSKQSSIGAPTDAAGMRASAFTSCGHTTALSFAALCHKLTHAVQQTTA